MITGCIFRKEKFVLNAESPADASMVKGGLVGKNTFTYSSPFGNRINISTEANSLSFFKPSGKAFTYEEIHGLIKKIELLGKIARLEEVNILTSARKDLDSKMTLFFPSESKPALAISFFYNWISIDLEDTKKFKEISVKLIELVEGISKSLMVYAGKYSSITIHNYDMGSLYFNKAQLDNIAQVLVDNGIISKEEKKRFIVRAAAFMIKSIIYMEARHIVKNADETFSFDEDSNYNPLIGNREFLQKFLKVMSWLGDKGLFISLNAEQLQTLADISDDPEILTKQSLSELIKQDIESFMKDFKDEITAARQARG